MPFCRTGLGFAYLLGVLSFFSPQSATASLFMGTGYSSISDGRAVPVLHLGVGFPTSDLTLNTSGVRTTSYSLAAYTISLFRVWNTGKVAWGDLTTGIGWGLNATQRKFIDTAGMISSWDFATGPAFRINWFVAGPVFIAIESILGLRNLGAHLTLTFQSITHASIGLRF